MSFVSKFTNSEKLLKKARKVTPLGAQTYSKSYRYFSEGKAPYFLERGKGCYVWDIDGNKYIDFICALGPIIIGYNDIRINNAIKEQLEKGIIFSQPSPVSIVLAEELVEIIPGADMVKFVKNGSDATNAAVKLARAYTGKDIILACGYHGMHDWYIGATENNKGVPEDVCKLTKKFKYNDTNSLKAMVERSKGNIAAVILEPIQEDGPDSDFLEEVKKISLENNAVLIFDEIKSGFWYALGGAAEYYGIEADMTAIGKGMANGMPISALAGKKEFLELIEKDNVFVSTTFGGESLSIAAALETIKILKNKDSYKHIWSLGNYLINNLKKIIVEQNLEKIVEVTGLAPYSGVKFGNKNNLDYLDFFTIYQSVMIKNGILCLNMNSINLSHSDKEIKLYLKSAQEAFELINKVLKEDSVLSTMNYKKINPVFKRY